MQLEYRGMMLLLLLSKKKKKKKCQWEYWVQMAPIGC